jgi:hypothetical protein
MQRYDINGPSCANFKSASGDFVLGARVGVRAGHPPDRRKEIYIYFFGPIETSPFKMAKKAKGAVRERRALISRLMY